MLIWCSIKDLLRILESVSRLSVHIHGKNNFLWSRRGNQMQQSPPIYWCYPKCRNSNWQYKRNAVVFIELRISCAEILEVGKNFFAASSVKKMSRFAVVSPDEIKRISWTFTKTVILLGLAGYELIITNSAYGLVGYIYISSYQARPRRITVKYCSKIYTRAFHSGKLKLFQLGQ